MTPDTLARSWDWEEQAACRRPGTDATLWQADVRSDAAARAATICQRDCPVRTTCLRDAMRHEGNDPTKYRQGVLGGLLPEQRSALHRELEARRARQHTTGAT